MSKKYIGYFSDLKDNDYKLEIECSTGSGTEEIIFGDNPITTEMNSEAENIYEPIRSQAATIEVVTNKFLFDVYSASATGTKVTLTNTTANKIDWIGFVEPLAFDQGFDYELETVQLDCIDGISVLEYLPYRSDNKDVVTFLQVIFRCLKQAGIFKYLYISDNVQLNSNTGTDSICEQICVSEQNFFEEKDDSCPFEEVAWNSLDVLSEICRFLGYTAVSHGENVYLIDYDSIKKNLNTYWCYDISGTSPVKKYRTTVAAHKDITDIPDYSSDGNTMSLAECYNKVSVKDEFYTYDNIVPELGDKKYEKNITKGYDWAWQNFPRTHDWFYVLCDTIQLTKSNGDPDNYQICVAHHWRGRMSIVVYKFYHSQFFKFNKYNSSRNLVAELNEISAPDMWTYNGAFYTKLMVKEISSNDYNSWRANYAANFNSLSNDARKKAWHKFLAADPGKVNLTPYIIGMNRDSGHIGPGNSNSTGNYHNCADEQEDCLKKPFVELREEFRKPDIFGGEGFYIIIKGTFRYHDEENSPYPMTGGKDNGELKRKDDLKDADQFYFWAKLKWGDKYWNGDGWQDTNTPFRLYYREKSLGRDDKKNYNHYDKDFEFFDTAQAIYGAEEKGVYIYCPDNANLSGQPEFVIYANRDMHGDSRRSHWHPAYNFGDNFYTRYYSRCVFIKDFEIKAVKQSDMFLEEEESDTVYTNFIDNGSVSEMDEITFKVCTEDGKTNNYSSVTKLSDNSYVKETYNKALHAEQSSTSGSSGTAAFLRQEEQYVYKTVCQYEKPRVILELNLKNEDYKLYQTFTDKTLSNRTYVPMTISTDYKYNKQIVKLIEKA